ncbi:MAG TPA: phosphodiester glycosidase family protein [Mycobacteriales bacterium]|nr:phosphodiester glycosidase family protein [Mycobacteriales bacterium]
MRIRRGLLLVAALLPVLGTALLAAPMAASARTHHAMSPPRTLASGVTYSTFRFPSKTYPEVIRVVTIAPSASVMPFVSLSNDQVAEPAARDRLERTSAACLRRQCVAGVNGDFFCTSAHCPKDIDEPEGGIVSNGRMLRSPYSIGWEEQQLSFDANGCPQPPQPLTWSGSLTSGGTTLALDGVNVDRHSGQAVLYDAAYGPAAPTRTAGVDLVLRLDDTDWLGDLSPAPVTATPVSLTAKQGGFPLQPGSGFVAISASGAKAKALQAMWAAWSPGQQMQLQLDTAVPVTNSIGGKPLLVQDGAYTGQWDNRAEVARTLVAWKPDCTRMLITVDGPSKASRGMSMPQEAAFAIALGATTAFGLDGGASTTLVGPGGALLNKPSYTGAGDRPTASSLLFVAA